jgi:hypothetical protein
VRSFLTLSIHHWFHSLFFLVEPIDLRIDDKAALLGRNFELSGWLLDLFIEHFPNLFQYNYITEVYNAVVWYVINSRPSMKSRGVEILVRLLFHLRSLMHKEQQAQGKPTPSTTAQSTEKGTALGKLAELKTTTQPVPSSSPPPPTSSSSGSHPFGFVYVLSSLPDFHKLAPLAQQMDSVLEAMGLNSSDAHGRRRHHQSLTSPTMMGLVELLSTVDLLSNEFEMYKAERSQKAGGDTGEAAQKKIAPASTSSLPAEAPIDLVDELHDRLRIDKAQLLFHAPPNDKAAQRAPKDITNELSRYLSWSNNLQLYVPTDPSQLQNIPGFENEVSASTLAGSSSAAASSSNNKKVGFNKLQVTYSILQPTWNANTQTLEHKVNKTVSKTISLMSHSKPTLIRPTSSRFENVVAMSRLTLEMKNSRGGSKLPPEFLLEAYRNYFLQKNFLSLVGKDTYDLKPGKPLVRASPALTSAHNGTRSFSVSFWMYLNTPAVMPAKDQSFRYIVHSGNMPEQNQTNLAHGIMWPTAGFSIGLGSKDAHIHTVFYDASGSAPVYGQTRSQVQPKRWTHITMIVTDGIDLNVYIDGSIELTQKFHASIPALPSDPVFVGGIPGGMLRLFRQQNRPNAAADQPPEDPYRAGGTFLGALKDVRLYAYDVDPSTFVPQMQEKVKKLDKERSDKTKFNIKVEVPAQPTRRDLIEVVQGGAGSKSAPQPSFSLTSSSSSAPPSVPWTPAMDIQVMELFHNVVSAIRNRRPQEQHEEDDEDQPRPQRESFTHMLDLPLAARGVLQTLHAPESKLIQSANLLAHVPLEAIRFRFATIQLLNAKLIDILAFVDFTQSRNEWSLAYRLSNISWLILMEVKAKAWRTILHSTAVGQTVNITVNRPRALKARERGNDPDGLRCLESSTLVALADGSQLPAREVKDGMVLIGHTGAPVHVARVTPVPDVTRMIRVESNHGGYTVTPEHRLTLRWNVAPVVTFGRCAPNSDAEPDRILLRVAWWDRTLSRRVHTWRVEGLSSREIDEKLLEKDFEHSVEPIETVSGSPEELCAMAHAWARERDAMTIGELVDVPAQKLLERWHMWNMQQPKGSKRADSEMNSQTVTGYILPVPQPVPLSTAASTAVPDALAAFAATAREADRVGRSFTHLTFKPTGEGEYRELTTGDNAAVVYQLLETSQTAHQEGQHLKAESHNAFTFLRFEEAHRRLGVDQKKADIVISELKYAACDSPAGTHDKLWFLNCKAALELGASRIVAFGAETHKRWLQFAATFAAQGVPVKQPVIHSSGTDLQSLQFSHDGVERVIYFAPHPAAWKQYDKLVASLAAAHCLPVTSSASLYARDMMSNIDRIVSCIEVTDFPAGATEFDVTNIEIEPEHEEDGREVVGSRRFVLGNGAVTHNSVFGQVFQQLHFLRPATLRIQQGNRPFRVKFAGEGGIDAGGVFRDLVSEVCSTLLSRDTPLFVPCPNAAGYGDNSNTFVPNPKCNTSLHLSMYSFVGKFIGMAIRGGHVLNLDLPPVVWKLIVAAPISREDIQDINALCFNVLEQYADSSLTPEQFSELPPQKFVTISTDGREIELKEGGANLTVTYENRLEYVRLEEHYRLHEFDLATEMIRKGLGTIVPVHLLSLFTANELETMVCGSRGTDRRKRIIKH